MLLGSGPESDSLNRLPPDRGIARLHGQSGPGRQDWRRPSTVDDPRLCTPRWGGRAAQRACLESRCPQGLMGSNPIPTASEGTNVTEERCAWDLKPTSHSPRRERSDRAGLSRLGSNPISTASREQRRGATATSHVSAERWECRPNSLVTGPQIRPPVSPITLRGARWPEASGRRVAADDRADFRDRPPDSRGRPATVR